PSVVATDFLESILQRAAGRVEELAAGRVGDLPQFARIGLTEPDRERPDRPRVRRQGVTPGQELVHWHTGIVLTVGHQHDRDVVTAIGDLVAGHHLVRPFQRGVDRGGSVRLQARDVVAHRGEPGRGRRRRVDPDVTLVLDVGRDNFVAPAFRPSGGSGAGHPGRGCRGGNTYVNVHTNDGVPPANTGPGDFPGGEIRGQIR